MSKNPELAEQAYRDVDAYMKSPAYRRSQKLIDAYNKCVEETGGAAWCLELLKRAAANGSEAP